YVVFFLFSSRRRHTRSKRDWSSDVCSSDLESQIGYTLIRKPMNWKPKEAKKEAGPISVSNLSSFLINFEEGRLNLEQLNAILDMLPFALTFIDEHDKVAYFGGGAEIYPHSRNAIGNDVFSCHTAKSRPLIKKIFAQFHSG